MCAAGQEWSTPITALMSWPTPRRAASSAASISTPSASPLPTFGRKRRDATIVSSSTSGRAILNPLEVGFLKAKDGEPAFGEPWHAETLALADLLVQSGVVSPAHWAE